jgi:hypothetical protein
MVHHYVADSCVKTTRRELYKIARLIGQDNAAELVAKLDTVSSNYQS